MIPHALFQRDVPRSGVLVGLDAFRKGVLDDAVAKKNQRVVDVECNSKGKKRGESGRIKRVGRAPHHCHAQDLRSLAVGRRRDGLIAFARRAAGQKAANTERQGETTHHLHIIAPGHC